MYCERPNTGPQNIKVVQILNSPTSLDRFIIKKIVFAFDFRIPGHMKAKQNLKKQKFSLFGIEKWLMNLGN
jgi:hypothetical protein